MVPAIGSFAAAEELQVLCESFVFSHGFPWIEEAHAADDQAFHDFTNGKHDRRLEHRRRRLFLGFPSA